MKKILALLLACVMVVGLLAGCGKSNNSDNKDNSGSLGREFRDTDVIDAYGTVTRNGKQIDVCVCHDQKAVYLYYDDEKHELFIIQSGSEVDSNWLRERLGMQKMKSYKTGKLTKSNVIDIKDVRHALEDRHPKP